MANMALVDIDKLDADMLSLANKIRARGNTTEKLQWPAGFEAAVEAISTIQRKTGTFTTNNSGQATVSCGFKPDLVAIDGGSNDGVSFFVGAAFYEGNVTRIRLSIMPTDTNSYVMSLVETNQTNNGFSVTATKLTPSFQVSNDTYRSISYIAIKYT